MLIINNIIIIVTFIATTHGWAYLDALHNKIIGPIDIQCLFTMAVCMRATYNMDNVRHQQNQYIDVVLGLRSPSYN